MTLNEIVDHLRCPVTGSPLKLVDAPCGPGAGFVPVPRRGCDTAPFGPTGKMLILRDESSGYPIVDDIPVLLGPEKLVPAASREEGVDLRDPLYAEAYAEMAHYNSVNPAGDDEPLRSMGGVTTHNAASIARSFPEPAGVWIDSPHDSLAQLDAYRHLAPVTGRTVMQLGGHGSHAVKMLLAGARRGFLVTPMLGEAQRAKRLAESYGVGHRFAAVLGLGEQIPLAADSIDLVVSGGCFHHTRLEYLAAELHRVLATGGRFAGYDAWKTPLHTIGTKLLGKRDPVNCRPITPGRLAHMTRWFPDMTSSRHGPLLRYLLLGLEKLIRASFRLPPSYRLPRSLLTRCLRVDNLVGRLARLEGNGGVVVMAGVKSGAAPATATGRATRLPAGTTGAHAGGAAAEGLTAQNLHSRCSTEKTGKPC